MRFSNPMERISALTLDWADAGRSGKQAAHAGREAAMRWLASVRDGAEQGDTVHVGRRRPSGPDTGPRERAEAPVRRRQDEACGGGSGNGGGSGGLGGRGIPTRLGGCGGLLVMLLVVGYYVINMLSSGTGTPPAEEPVQPTEPPAIASVAPAQQPTATSAVSARPTASTVTIQKPAQPSGQGGSKPGQRWTVLLYQDGDDKVLDQDLFIDLNEAERVGSSERVNVIAQLDRYRDADGAKRFYVTRDQDLNQVASKELANLGNINMSDPNTLGDFVTWAVRAYPADKYVLILSDHGMGWPGGWSDAGSKNEQPSAATSVPLARALGNQLYLMDLDRVLGQIRSQAGIDKFELIGLDACLMGQLEVYSALAPHARYAVASEETEPALGWAYTAFLSALQRNPDAGGAELGRQIVQSYIQDDQRITDEQARAEFMRQGTPMGSFFEALGAPSSDQLAQQLGDSITLAVLDLEALPSLMQSVNEFSSALQGVPQESVAQARTYAQSFTSIFGPKVPPSYIDLGHFAALVARSANNADVTRAANGVQNALKVAVLAEKHGPKRPGATGVAIYFPNSQLYRTPVAGPQSYTAVAQRFAGESSWPNFLAFHYTGQRFSADTRVSAVPDLSTPVRGPGAGNVQISPIRLTGSTVVPGNAITMRADVSGQNVGYAYFFTGYLDKQAQAINIADTDYLDSPQTRELNGVYYPDWGGRDSFTLEFDWEPLMFAISDGQTTAQVLLQPQSYGAEAAQAVYTVEGMYTFSGEGDSRYAKLYFSNGLLRQVLGFTTDQSEGTGAPREIVPQTGDRFTVLEKWLDLDSNGQVQGEARQEGKTLTFGRQTFTWKQLDAAAGDYVVGFIVEDLDGNATQSFAQVRVQ